MRAPRRALLLLLPIALAFLLSIAATASASGTPWGELARFEGKEKEGEHKGSRFLFSAGTHMFGVDQHENDVFVGSELNELHIGKFRIQKYTEAGKWLGELSLAPPVEPGTEEAAPKEPLAQGEGFAIDAEAGIVYLLVVYNRSGSDKHDPAVTAAGGLYAFKAEPESEKLVPAPGTKTNGLLLSLEPGSETAGKALLNPHGLAVDPKTHEVLILGESDRSKTTTEQVMHLAVVRVGKEGKEEPEYVSEKEVGEEEPDAGLPGSSPVVSSNGNLYFERLNALFETNLKSSAPPTPVYVFSGVELVNFGEGLNTTPEGAELTIGPVEAGVQRLFVSSLTGSQQGESINTALMLGLEDSVKPTVAELGWTGGVLSESSKPCAIEFGGDQNPLVAAGKNGEVFALTSRAPKLEDSEGEVVKFGPGGSGCPTAQSGGPIEVSFEGTKVSEPDTTHAFTLATKVAGQNPASPGANVLSTAWIIGGEKVTVTTPSGLETQTAEVEHKFSSGGEVPVEAKIHTDDLAGPEVVTDKTTLHVKGAVGCEIKQQPAEQSVVEPEAAKFTVATAGCAKPTFQWEVSEDEGAHWKELTGQTGETFELATTNASENGHEYRVVVTNGAEKKTSTAAKLSVLAYAAPAISEQPAAAEVEEGQTATFKAAASGAPAPTVQWEVSTNGGTTFSPVPGATAATLKLEHTALSQSGAEYRAVFSNANPVTKEVKTATTNAAKLTVKFVAPQISSQPASVEVEEGQTASFKAAASGSPTSVQWEASSNGGSSFTPVGGATAATLTIEHTTLAQSGTEYRAVFSKTNPVTKEVKTATSNAAKLTVTRKPPPPPPTTSTSSPPPPPPPVGEVKGFVEASPAARLASSSITVSQGGALTIKISCPANATCTGTVTLKTLTAVAARAHLSKKAKKAILTLAQGSFTIAGGAAGSSRSLTLHLSSKAKQLLARAHTLRARATVTAHNNAGASATASSVLTLRLEAKKKKHH